LAVCRAAVAASVLGLVLIPSVDAQPPGFGGFGGGPAQPAREAAPVDLTGTWVSLVTEDWIERMSPDSPASGTGGGFGFGGGGFGGRQGGEPPVRSSDPCAAYGAGGIMRVPGRVRIRWEDENTLRFDFDAGSQRRIVHFGDDAAAAGSLSLQGHSTATWEGGTGGGGGRRGRAPVDDDAKRWGSLEIDTSNLSSGYLLSSRSWYGDNASLTELIRYHHDFGQDYFTVTAVIEENGVTTSTTSSTFKKEANDSKFAPTRCEIVPRP
jgi:hypothetical protein